jgi:hypothetical protein
MKKLTSVLLILVVIPACIKKSTTVGVNTDKSPEEVVRSFLDLSAGAKEEADKKKLEEFCTGELRRTFERMTEESFRLSYLNSELKLNDVKVIESSTERDLAKVRYQVSVNNRQGTDPTHEMNEREVALVRSQGAWYIESIHLKGSDKIAFTRGMIF